MLLEMDENLVKMDKLLNKLTESKEILLELRGKSKRAGTAKGYVNMKPVAE
jgi:hypothetical protein